MEHDNCNYYAYKVSDWIWYCNKCGWIKVYKNDKAF